MSRLDKRTLGEFKNHMRFTTEIESRLMECWAVSTNSPCLAYIDQGVDNDGGYVENGVDTSDVDFIVITEDSQEKVELKFVPTAGKLTLKLNDVKNYIRQQASILFIFNTSSESLKVPKDLDIESHWERVKQTHEKGELKWALVDYKTLGKMLGSTEPQKIPYMGGKTGIIITQKRYDKFFTLMDFTYDD